MVALEMRVSPAVTDPRVAELVLEYGGNPLALATSRPRLSWRLEAGPEDWRQAA
jgi:hypothetical protein